MEPRWIHSKNLDSHKLELLEARFAGRSSSQMKDGDSNISATSQTSLNSSEDKDGDTPEKQRARSERKRKARSSDGAGNQDPSAAQAPSKKISDFFSKNTSTSPGRNIGSPGRSQGLGVINPMSPSTGFSGMFTQPQLDSPGSSSSYTSQRKPETRNPNTQDAEVQIVDSNEADLRVCRSKISQLEEMLQSKHQENERLRNQLKAEEQANGELKRQSETMQRSIKKYEESMLKCRLLNKQMLIKESVRLKKEVREKCMTDRLRLGQFTTQRKGAHFNEVWVDGYAFTALQKKQEHLTQEKEELERQRKILNKRKPPASGQATTPKQKVKVNGTDEGFVKPAPQPSLTFQEYHERDEILKIRSNAFKKEESDLQMELEKLEKSRNLHIRELKRIHSEDNSRFKDHPTLNDRYLLLNLLGKGGFSEVYKGYDLKEMRYVACKIHQLNRDWKEDKKANYIKHALREYEIHKKLDHCRIVKLYDVFEIDQNSFCTVLEYCDGSDLDFYLKQHKVIPEREARSIVQQTVSALKYLNESKPSIIHYDLKPGNLLLGSRPNSFEVKITDFGLSKIMDENNLDSSDGGIDLTSQGAGTYWYLPPECFVVGKEPPRISSKVDVWSVGIIFYQCLYGKKPFGHNLTQASILEENTILKATEVHYPTKPVVSNEAKSFIRRCLAYKKENRSDVLTLAKDPYLLPTTKKALTNNSVNNSPSHSNANNG